MIGLTWIGHATVVIDLDGVRLLTDPLLNRHAGALRRIGPAPRPALWQGTDAVLVSHLHHDHAEVSSLRLLPGIPVLAGDRNARWLRRRVGAQAHGIAEDAWQEVAAGSGVDARLVRADHSGRPMPHRPNDAHGHLVRGAAGTVWFAGDTSLYDEMAALPELAGGRIDVALVPIAGWGPRLSPGHLGPQEAAEACARVGPRAVLPIHHGTLHPRGFQHVGNLAWMHRPLDDFARRLAATAPSVELLTPGLGGQVDYD